jgi:hypothetical protein
LVAVTGLVIFWVLELKRDPHAPFVSVQQVLIIQAPRVKPRGIIQKDLSIIVIHSLSPSLQAGECARCAFSS